MIKNKKILLTGGCGFIGNTLSSAIISNNPADFLVIDKMTYVSDRTFHDKNNINIVATDITSDEAFDLVLQFKPDIIVNMAAESHVDRSIEEPDIFLKSNVYGTTNLMNAALKLESVPLFVQISTDEIYGDIASGWSKEDDPRKTSSPYSASKASAEMFVEAYGRTFKLPYIITRSSNNYGPYQHIEKFIPKAINNILNGKKVPVYGDGLQERDWVYVEDNCDAIIAIVNNAELASNSIFNIGGISTCTNIEILTQICILMSEDPKELIDYVKDRPGHDRRYAIDIKKIKDTFGWEPKTSLHDGLLKTIEWHRKKV